MDDMLLVSDLSFFLSVLSLSLLVFDYCSGTFLSCRYPSHPLLRSCIFVTFPFQHLSFSHVQTRGNYGCMASTSSKEPIREELGNSSAAISFIRVLHILE